MAKFDDRSACYPSFHVYNQQVLVCYAPIFLPSTPGAPSFFEGVNPINYHEVNRSCPTYLNWAIWLSVTAPPSQVCSGTGDWVVAQAQADTEANWVASVSALG